MSQYRQNDRDNQLRQSSIERRKAYQQRQEELQRKEERKYEALRRKNEQEARQRARKAKQTQRVQQSAQAQYQQQAQAAQQYQQQMQLPTQGQYQQPAQVQYQQPAQTQYQQQAQVTQQRQNRQSQNSQQRRSTQKNGTAAVPQKRAGTKTAAGAAAIRAGNGKNSSRPQGGKGHGTVAARGQKKRKFSQLWLFPVMFLWCELLLRIFTGTGTQRIMYPIVFGLSAGLLVAGIILLIPKKYNRIVSLVLLYVTAVLFITECLLHQSYQVYMTLSSVKNGAGGVTGNYTSELIGAIVHGIPEMVMFLLPAILYTVVGKVRMPSRKYPPLLAGALVVISLVLFGFGALCASHGSAANVYKSKNSFDATTQNFGLLTGLRMEAFGGSSGSSLVIEDTAPAAEASNDVSEDTSAQEASAVEEPVVIQGDNVMDLDLETLMNSSDSEVAEISTYVKSLTPSNKNAYTGLFEGKNLILICAEAFSDCVIDEQLTPTLYRLVHNGFYFSEYYQPTWGGSTSSGEYSFVMGLMPLRGTDTMLDSQNNNNYFTMGNQLQRLGYWSSAYHASDYDYYDRNLTHENLGYGQWLGEFNGIEDICGDYAGDDDFLNLTLDSYIDNQPFSIYCMTLSGHCVYTEEKIFVSKYYDQIKARYGDNYMETTLYYLCYQQELEVALTNLVAKLEKAGIADDTVICLTSDHFPYGLRDGAYGNEADYLADLYGYAYSTSFEQDHNTLIIWSGCLENENKDMACEISEPTYSLDILPTLSNLFGLEYDSRLLVGRDVFSNQEALVAWGNCSWATTYGKYDAWSGEFIPNAGYESYANDQTYLNRIHQKVSNIISISDKILDCNYYGAVFGEDDVTDNSLWEKLYGGVNAAGTTGSGAEAGVTGTTAGNDTDTADAETGETGTAEES